MASGQLVETNILSKDGVQSLWAFLVDWGPRSKSVTWPWGWWSGGRWLRVCMGQWHSRCPGILPLCSVWSPETGEGSGAQGTQV